MESRLLEGISVSADELKLLADKRAEAVRSYLESTGGIAPERLFIVEPEDASKVAADTGESQVIFDLQ